MSDKFDKAAEYIQKFSDIIGKGKDTLKEFVDKLKTVPEEIIAAVRNGLSGFGSSAWSFVKGLFTGGGEKNATGAISFGGGFTQMNENARGEIVQLPGGSKIYPYSTTERILKKMAGRTLGGSTHNNVFNVSIDARGSNLSKQEVRRLKNEIVNSIVEAFDNTVPA